MNELDLLRKKTGMTIAKAWMLMATTIVIFILDNTAFKLLINSKTISIKNFDGATFYFISLFVATFLGCVWGFFINKKQMPFFKNQSLLIWFWCIIIALVWAYISPVVFDILPMNIPKQKNPESLEIGSFFSLTSLLLFIILQIGIIGNGLLKNYALRQAIFTIMAVGIVMLNPIAVISIAFQTLFLFYIYYRTAAFQLPIFMVFIFGALEEILPLYFDANYSTNYIRNYFIQNNSVYYIGLVVCVSLIIGGLYYIKTHTKLIEWQRPEEDENIEFL